VRIPGLFCVRGIFKIAEFVSFTGTSTTSEYVVKPVKETYETVHNLLKETCQKWTQFDEPYKTTFFWGVEETSKEAKVGDLGLCKFVEYFHVFPTSYLRRWKGPTVPKETSKTWTWRKSLGNTFFQTNHDARYQPFPTFPGGKTETRRMEHRVYWFPSLFIRSHICDGRNCELLMIQI